MGEFIENIHSHRAEKIIEAARRLSIEDSVLEDKLKRAILKAVETFYRSHTFRETCEEFGIIPTSRMQKIMHRLWPKGMGRGGARKGSGNKKGVKLKKRI